MKIIYYVGGPFDQHKVARQQDPDRILVMRTSGPLEVTDLTATSKIEDHRYFVRPIGKTCFGDEVFVATHEDIRP